MKKNILLLATVIFFAACTTNSVTGRKQLALFGEETLQQQSITEYQSFLSKNKVISSS